MSLMRKKLVVVVIVILSLVIAAGASAQDMGQPRVSYFLADDANGIDQVWQLLLDGISKPRQLSSAETDVLTFGASYDGLAVAYISGGQLWLQPIHTEEAQALAPVSATQFSYGPIFSQDGQYVAYPDGGVWLLDLGTRETRQLLANVDLTGNNEMSEFRIFNPQQFVADADGRATHLIVDVGVWEWNSAGVYDLATDSFLQLEGPDHTNLLPLSGGRVLVFGNNGIGGDPGLSFAPSLAEINDAVRVLGFGDLTDETLFAEGAVEIAPDLVRIYGQSIPSVPGEAIYFTFDYDLTMGARPVNFIIVSKPGQETAIYSPLSPDGAVMPVYINNTYTNAATVVGSLHLLDVITRDVVSAPLPEQTGLFVWQP